MKPRDTRPKRIQALAASARSGGSSARTVGSEVEPHVRSDCTIGFRESLALRNYRADLLKIRSKFHEYTATKFKNIRELYAELDCDKDGQISIQDWRQGLRNCK